MTLKQALKTKEKCDCEEMSCKEGCSKRHTHKGFFCEKCRPVEKYELSEKETAECENIKKTIKILKKEFGHECKDFEYECVVCEVYHAIDILEDVLETYKV